MSEASRRGPVRAVAERPARATAPTVGDPNSVEALREEILRLRDRLAGEQAINAAALGRVAELESWVLRYEKLAADRDAMLRSRIWRAGRRAIAPLRWLRRPV